MKKEKMKEEDNRRANNYNETRVICKCGRRLPVPVYKDKIMCKWCGRTVYNTSRAYFKNKLMEEINRMEVGEK